MANKASERFQIGARSPKRRFHKLVQTDRPGSAAVDPATKILTL
jgi:hypothetical protein